MIVMQSGIEPEKCHPLLHQKRTKSTTIFIYTKFKALNYCIEVDRGKDKIK